MNAQMHTPPAGWVTVAEAAKFLTAAGDTIDSSNVSRYLGRWKDVPQIRIGKYRYVDPVALRTHRRTNVLVADKSGARDPALPVAPAPLLDARPPRAAEEVDEDAPLGSPLQQANLDLKRLQIRERELDLAEREGRLVPDTEVIALLSAVTQVLVSEMERQEITMIQTFGREVGAAFRRARKTAQAQSAARLADLARKHLPAPLASLALDTATSSGAETEMAA